MIEFLKKYLSYDTNTLKLVNRSLNYSFCKNEQTNNQIKKYGYAHIQNVVSAQELNFLEVGFQTLSKYPDFVINEKFQNSGRYQSPEIRSFVMDTIGKFSSSFLPTLFDLNIYDENTTGAFQIKPPSPKSGLNPHQDAPVIDELEFNGLFIWIPLCDITIDNGAIYLLPGSHLWGNHQRSLNVKWPLEKFISILWNYMEPIYMKKGDVLIWDTALIHASSPNLSNENRIAITTTILPKKFRMVEYVKDKKTPQNKVEKYHVERSFWETCNIMERPPCPPNIFLGYEDLTFPEDISKNQLINLIQMTKKILKE